MAKNVQVVEIRFAKHLTIVDWGTSWATLIIKPRYLAHLAAADDCTIRELSSGWICGETMTES